MSKDETPTNEEINKYRVTEAVTSTNQDLNKDDEYDLKNQKEDFESDFDVKSTLLDLRANEINPFFNQKDIALSNINTKDKAIMNEMNYYIDFGIVLYENGFKESALLCADKVLTKLNFARSFDGFQQKMLITRIKAAQLELQKEREGGVMQSAKKKFRRNG